MALAHFKDQFKFEKKLGEGGFAQVYKVRSLADGREYALKLVDVQKYKITSQDYRSEFDLMVKLRHPNILAIYGSHEIVLDFVQCFAIQMQYCPKGDLSSYIESRRGRLLSMKRLVSWIEQLSSALEFIHSYHIIHRDLKPENTLLSNDGNLLISDFGIAKVVPDKYTNTCIGTPYFVAPEVLTGKRYDDKVDIYSLGKLFICMATAKIIPGDVSTIPKSLDEDFCEIMKRSVSPTPQYRPTAKYIHQSVSALQI